MIPLLGLLLLGCGKAKDTTGIPGPASGAGPALPSIVYLQPPAPLRTVPVYSADGLKAALLDARPGDEIVLANGVYGGRFVVPATQAGSAEHPIVLRGGRGAILDAGSTQTGYVLHLQADHWFVRGITVRNGLKGIMGDGVRHNVIDSVLLDGLGEEGIHLRKFSTHNTIQRSEIRNTGLKTADYGEGIYIGSAKTNWATYTGGAPDRSDSNRIVGNVIGPGVAAECIDIKEGTTGGLVQGNRFDATGIQGANAADSWIDVKGNYWLITGNTGSNPAGSRLLDGYQVHVALDGWGNYNEFKGNTSAVNAAGFGFLVKLTSSNGTAVGNKVYADNVVTGAASGASNIPLTH
ncbi:MAG: coagulation factor 5/8 type domain-containing protein [Chitinophagaceae bacterium]|nr:MAG: coagulation factor 5/8 type domain-containing protein [Chitinophagaceae bacterium]